MTTTGGSIDKVRDNWGNRSENMKCNTCMWYAPKQGNGRCRRHAPTMSGYPVVFSDDWCGDHKLNEVPPIVLSGPGEVPL